ncbi:hypothetical protein EC973_007258 [Apophysomyces ossiformis]|uniref:Amino acid transporter transmembrane domain-containing protein n=1 Tax=Apophysomyces ossiformis TaxID=679940 RepID=A0A8H7BQ51_9FUNG|nr:hypothetical protein EC973_007258 [Apophysomyces ossiformis]
MAVEEYHPAPASSPPVESFKVEETVIDNYIEDDARSSVTNEFGHGKGGFMTAYFNVVCIVAGTGTLGLPQAFAQGGWLGILIMMLAFFMAVYSGIVIIRCLYYKPGHRLHDYKEVGKAAFGWYGYGIATTLHYLNLFGCPGLYLVLAGQNMIYLCKNTPAELTYPLWVIIFGVALLLPAISMRTLREVTAVSTIGAVCTAIAVFIVLIQAPMDRNAHPERVVITDGVVWSGFPTALATIAFSYGGINTYPHVEHALRKPHQWKWALATGLGTCTILYFMTAVPGYWAYGRETASPIYDSLPDYPNRTGRLIAIIVMTIHVVLAVPIYTTSFSLEFEKFAHVSDERFGRFGGWLARAVIRSATMAVLVILAIYVKHFNYFMALIGALSNCGLVFLLPVFCYLKLTGWRNKPYYELAFCALTIALGLVGCVYGTIDAVRGLITAFQNDH